MPIEIPIGQSVGPNKIVSWLGDGRTGSVYLAQHEVTGQEVAIKFTRPDFLFPAVSDAARKELQDRYVRESTKIATIHHPNIVTTHNVGFDGDPWYIVMEYIDGLNLDELRDGDQKFLSQDILRIGKDVLNALKHAWQTGTIAHRNLNLKNIFLTVDDAIKVADLGLSRYWTSDGGLPRISPQAYNYVAPELLDGTQPPALAHDIYALGAVLYEMCAGRPAFSGDSVAEILAAKLEKRYTPLAEVNSEISPELIRLVDSMLEPQAEKRIANYDAIEMALLASQGKETDFPKCPHCSQNIPVNPMMIGRDMQCPMCNAVFTVPNFLRVAALLIRLDERKEKEAPAPTSPRNAGRPILDKLSADDQALLRELGVDVKRLQNLTTSNLWEFEIAAQLFQIVMAATRNKLKAGNAVPLLVFDPHLDRESFNAARRDLVQKLFQMQAAMRQFMAVELERELTKGDVNAIVRLTKKLHKDMDQAAGIHVQLARLPLPEEELVVDLRRVLSMVPLAFRKHEEKAMKSAGTNPHLELKKALLGWTPAMCRSVADVIAYLRHHGASIRNEARSPLQASFVPHDLQRFVRLAAAAEVGFRATG